ncbi:hypothetical protein NHX12_000752 [Muraenolepis orangiensis]|uniref:Xylose isomerase n=1 Tax=Muraenolepis orangiensis TaxID=630683 RepID=A0A9Q0DZE9_9TELE|nr:hypothetical protein NHX12_000752 [Muraenolepis orangiensis]
MSVQSLAPASPPVAPVAPEAPGDSGDSGQVTAVAGGGSPRPIPSVHCKLCLSEHPSAATGTLDACGCVFCTACLQQYAGLAVMEGGGAPVTCPDMACQKTGALLDSEIAGLVTGEQLELYQRLKFERGVKLDPSRAWCPVVACQAVCSLSPSSTEGEPTSVPCPACNAVFCSTCRGPWDADDHSCSETQPIMSASSSSPERRERSGTDGDTAIKQCPMCDIYIERNQGCAQMLCKSCKHTFCWYCLQNLDGDIFLRHYDKGPCRNKLGHSRASVMWNRTQVVGILVGVSLIALVTSPLLLLVSPCILCCVCKPCDAGISRIPYLPRAGPQDVLCFKQYNAEEVLLGRTMEDWLRFSVCYWHSFCWTGADPFGFQTLHRPWNQGTPMEAAKNRLGAAFEFFTKLGVKYYTFHDRDMAPEGSTLEESNSNLEQLTDLALQLQARTGVRVLWVTCNLFAHPRYMNGAATNPDCHVLAYAGAQVKKGLDVAKKLGAENFVFWGGREGFHSILNTDVAAELKHMANFFKMAVKYKEKIGLKCQFLIEPKPKEPCKHQYDYDAMSVIGFLKHYGLDDHFKLNIEPNHTTLAGHSYEHDVVMASAFGMLGSVDSNTGSPDLGWDTDQFPMDTRNTTLVMKAVIEQGGLQPGGLNFDAKVRRESTDLEDLFVAHIGAMDAFARGLRNAARLMEEGLLPGMVKERYSSFDQGLGLKVEEGSATLEDMEAFIKLNGEPKVASGKQEKYESIFNHYI